MGYHPQVILAGRAVNDYMPKYVVEMSVKGLIAVGKVVKGSKVLIMGLTYKENVPDIRETPSKDIISEFNEYGVKIYGYDPMLRNIDQVFGIEGTTHPMELRDIDCVVITVNHDSFFQITLNDLKAIMSADPVIIDVRKLLNADEAKQQGFYYKSL